MYDQNQLNPSEQAQSVGVDLPVHSGLKFALGNITKSHPIHTVQGFRRIRNFALQHQAGIILGKKSRVCGCGKRKINKDLPRGVVYNEKTQKLILIMSNIAALFGFVLNVLGKLLNNVSEK